MISIDFELSIWRITKCPPFEKRMIKREEVLQRKRKNVKRYSKNGNEKSKTYGKEAKIERQNYAKWVNICISQEEEKYVGKGEGAVWFSEQ